MNDGAIVRRRSGASTTLGDIDRAVVERSNPIEDLGPPPMDKFGNGREPCAMLKRWLRGRGTPPLDQSQFQGSGITAYLDQGGEFEHE